MLTKNSPLGPMLEHGAKKLHERGVLDYLKTRWLGGSGPCRPLVDMEASNMVLGLDQVSFVFVFLIGLMLLSFMMFLVEVFKKHQNGIWMKFKRIKSSDEEKGDKNSFSEKEYNSKDTKDEEKENKTSIFNFIWNLSDNAG